DEPGLAVRRDGPGVRRQHVEADPVHVQMLERVVDQRPDRVLPDPLAPELPADPDAELADAAEVIDPVEAGLPDHLALHIDPEIGTIVVALREVLVELRLELSERAGHDRPRTPEDGDLEVRDELPQSGALPPLDRAGHAPFTVQHPVARPRSRLCRQPSPSFPEPGSEEVSDPGSTIASWVRS